MPFIKVKDLNMYFEIHGFGEPLILIAGLGVDHSIFNSSIKVLSQKFRVIVFDNRGVGSTDKPNTPYSIEMMAYDTANLMNALEIDSAYVLGTSLGGRIAMELTLQYPEKIKGLLLTSTSASVKVRMPILPKIIKKIRGLMDKSEQPYFAFKLQLDASKNYDCIGRLKNIKVPTLILHGKKDKSALFEQATDMNNEIKNSKLITFRGGHLFFIFENKKFTDTIIDFLNSLEQSTFK
jgi:3-oxoadipate enol-lactonase